MFEVFESKTIRASLVRAIKQSSAFERARRDHGWQLKNYGTWCRDLVVGRQYIAEADRNFSGLHADGDKEMPQAFEGLVIEKIRCKIEGKRCGIFTELLEQ